MSFPGAAVFAAPGDRQASNHELGSSARVLSQGRAGQHFLYSSRGPGGSAAPRGGAGVKLPRYLPGGAALHVLLCTFNGLCGRSRSSHFVCAAIAAQNCKALSAMRAGLAGIHLDISLAQQQLSLAMPLALPVPCTHWPERQQFVLSCVAGAAELRGASRRACRRGGLGPEFTSCPAF